MIAIGKDIYMFGGQGRTMFDELRMLDCSRRDQYNWTLINTEEELDPSLSQSRELHIPAGGEVADAPGSRTAAVFCRYGHKLMLYGGSGPYISHIKSRRCYYDIFEYDTLTKRWFEDKRPKKGQAPSYKRINHAGDVLGCILAAFGGYDGE